MDNYYDFQIRSKRWQRYFMYLTLAVSSTLAVLVVLLCGLQILPENYWLILLLPGLLIVLSGLGTYVALVERFTLKDGLFYYRKPFLKSQSAQVSDVAKVQLIGGTFGIDTVEFLDAEGNVLISFLDDGTCIRNEAFRHAIVGLEIENVGFDWNQFL